MLPIALPPPGRGDNHVGDLRKIRRRVDGEHRGLHAAGGGNGNFALPQLAPLATTPAFRSLSVPAMILSSCGKMVPQGFACPCPAPPARPFTYPHQAVRSIREEGQRLAAYTSSSCLPARTLPARPPRPCPPHCPLPGPLRVHCRCCRAVVTRR